uniref:PPP1R35_C domain-containing protein n=1 Tax=Heligmosomoides polygyrus TaxID=6339 RepID=A0A8L8Q5V7_HELPZ
LRKKRRKRNKNTQSLVMNSSESPSSSHPLDPNNRAGAMTPDDAPIVEDDEALGTDGKQLLSGSCPDLSEEQLEMWDNYLYAATVESKEQNGKLTPPRSPKQQDVNEASGASVASTKVYDVLPRSLRDVAEQQLDGFSNPEIRRLDREINGNDMSSSMVMKRLAEQRFVDSDGSTQRSLAAEMKELTFRPEISSDQCEEDCFEGMNITVNAFDVCDDLTLSDIEKAPTRFEQIQQALKQNTQRYTADLRPPERVCCVLM